MNDKIIIYTDGSSRGNPGPGGYGIVMMYGSHRKEFCAGYRKTTNNRMELLAVIVALENIRRKDIPVEIYTDSKYVAESITKGWLNNWVRTDFRGGKKNKDLWMRYSKLAKQFTITVHWVKGHAANVYNNRCDQLATAAADAGNGLVDEGYESGLVS